MRLRVRFLLSLLVCCSCATTAAPTPPLEPRLRALVGGWQRKEFGVTCVPDVDKRNREQARLLGPSAVKIGSGPGYKLGIMHPVRRDPAALHLGPDGTFVLDEDMAGRFSLSSVDDEHETMTLELRGPEGYTHWKIHVVHEDRFDLVLASDDRLTFCRVKQ